MSHSVRGKSCFRYLFQAGVTSVRINRCQSIEWEFSVPERTLGTVVQTCRKTCGSFAVDPRETDESATPGCKSEALYFRVYRDISCQSRCSKICAKLKIVCCVRSNYNEYRVHLHLETGLVQSCSWLLAQVERNNYFQFCNT